jgi:hypothetical protein
MTIWIAKALDVAQHSDNQIELLIAEAHDANRKARRLIEEEVREIEEAESRPEAPKPPNTQGQAELSDWLSRDAHSQCIPVFFGAARAAALLFFNASLVRPVVHLSIASLSNRQSSPILKAGILPMRAIL